MGRVEIRQAIAAQMQSAGISFLGTCYPARPIIMQEADYVQTMDGYAVQQSDNGSSCVLVVNLPDDHRARETLTGRGHVDDRNFHKVALELFFASTGGDAVAAQLDYDSIVDAIVVAVRENPTPGGAAVVWSAGEFRAGVDHSQSAAFTSDEGMTVMINGVIKYEAQEWISGTNV